MLGDLASHGVDLVRYLLGEVESVFADTAIFIAQRPVPRGAASGHQLASGAHRDEVENEDYVVAWDFRRIGELRVGTGAAFQDQAVTTRYVGPGDCEYAAFQPASAMAMGYDELKVIEARRFLQSIESGSPVGATIWDAVATAQVIEAIAESVRSGSWQRPHAAD